MIKQIFLYLNQKDSFSLFLITILMIFGNVLEIISIGTIPIFLKLVLDPSDLIKKAPDFTQELLAKFDFSQSNFLIVFSIILLMVFILKNLYLLAFSIIKKNFIKILELRILISYSISIFPNHIVIFYQTTLLICLGV